MQGEPRAFYFGVQLVQGLFFLRGSGRGCVGLRFSFRTGKIPRHNPLDRARQVYREDPRVRASQNTFILS
jgi:hypothetical protein